MNEASRSHAVRLIGSVFLWVFGAGLVVLAYEDVILQRFDWPRGVPICPGLIHGECPAPPHVQMLGGEYTFVQAGVLLCGVALGGALMLLSGKGWGRCRLLAPLGVLVGVTAGVILHWAVWGGPWFFEVTINNAQRVLGWARLAPVVGLGIGAALLLVLLIRAERTGRG